MVTDVKQGRPRHQFVKRQTQTNDGQVRVHGVDFSGAKQAGKKVWIASGTLNGALLHLETCVRGESLPGGGRERARCLPALVRFIESERGAAFGLDFPFGIPKQLVPEDCWWDFIDSFPSRFPTPEDFRNSCSRAANGSELKRLTDTECRTPFSPYNLRLFRQTYFGIRDVLRPLVTRGKACVLPMQKPEAGLAQVLEVCPASTLKLRGRPRSYKGRSEQHREARQQILEELRADVIIPQRLTSIAVEDVEGDALDSMIAAQATSRALVDHRDAVASEGDYLIEGRIYV